MSWINDLCKSVKSKCWCWCQCICCPHGDVHTESDDVPPIHTPSDSSSRIEAKIKTFYNSLPNTPVQERNEYFINTSKQQVDLNQNVHNHEEKSDNRPELPSRK